MASAALWLYFSRHQYHHYHDIDFYVCIVSILLHILLLLFILIAEALHISRELPTFLGRCYQLSQYRICMKIAWRIDTFPMFVFAETSTRSKCYHSSFQVTFGKYLSDTKKLYREESEADSISRDFNAKTLHPVS